MKITDYSPVNKPGATTKKKAVSGSSSGGDFLGLLSAAETETSAAVSSTSDVQVIGSLDSLLSLQEMPDEEVSKRKAAISESRGALDALEALRQSLLTGSIPENMLQRLNHVAALRKQAIDDPQLKSIIEDIELRAAVELAKLERASKQH